MAALWYKEPCYVVRAESHRNLRKSVKINNFRMNQSPIDTSLRFLEKDLSLNTFLP